MTERPNSLHHIDISAILWGHSSSVWHVRLAHRSCHTIQLDLPICTITNSYIYAEEFFFFEFCNEHSLSLSLRNNYGATGKDQNQIPATEFFCNWTNEVAQSFNFAPTWNFIICSNDYNLLHELKGKSSWFLKTNRYELLSHQNHLSLANRSIRSNQTIF